MAGQISKEQIACDICNLRTIYDVFDRLSLKGKGVCIENLVRKFAEEKMEYRLEKELDENLGSPVYYLWVMGDSGKWEPFSSFDRLKTMDNERGPMYQVRFYDLTKACDFVDMLKQNIGWSERNLKITEKTDRHLAMTTSDLVEGDECWVIEMTAYGPVASKAYWHEHLEGLRSLGLILLTKEEAERDISRRLAREVLLNDTKGFKPDWNNHSQEKTLVYYDSDDKTLKIVQWSVNAFGGIYFANEEDAEASIKTHEKEWKVYLGVMSK